MFLRSNEMHSIITLLCVRRFSQHRKPNGIALSPDGGTLAVPDYGGTQTWTFRINASGVLDAMMPTMPMRLPIDSKGEFKFNEPPHTSRTQKGTA